MYHNQGQTVSTFAMENEQMLTKGLRSGESCESSGQTKRNHEDHEKENVTMVTNESAQPGGSDEERLQERIAQLDGVGQLSAKVALYLGGEIGWEETEAENEVETMRDIRKLAWAIERALNKKYFADIRQWCYANFPQYIKDDDDLPGPTTVASKSVNNALNRLGWEESDEGALKFVEEVLKQSGGQLFSLEVFLNFFRPTKNQLIDMKRKRKRKLKREETELRFRMQIPDDGKIEDIVDKIPLDKFESPTEKEEQFEKTQNDVERMVRKALKPKELEVWFAMLEVQEEDNKENNTRVAKRLGVSEGTIRNRKKSILKKLKLVFPQEMNQE